MGLSLPNRQTALSLSIYISSSNTQTHTCTKNVMQHSHVQSNFLLRTHALSQSCLLSASEMPIVHDTELLLSSVMAATATTQWMAARVPAFSVCVSLQYLNAKR